MLKFLTAFATTTNLKYFNTFAVRAKSTIQSYHVDSNQMKSSYTDFSYINSTVAKAIDDTLMTEPGFTLDQLMELAGLAVAQSAHLFIQSQPQSNPKNREILVLCGPGNNGGDGLVASRHLKHFGYMPSIIYPKAGKSQIFVNLVKQCQDLDIPFIEQEQFLNNVQGHKEHSYALIIDSLFGFSFEGIPREPYKSLIQYMSTTTTIPTLSVDIPSGWHVEQGDIHKLGFDPAAVISLTLPKECMRGYHGIHYLGGRFVPPGIVSEFGLTMPDYGFGFNQVIQLSSLQETCMDTNETDEA